MRQVLQNLKSGETLVADVPVPNCGPKHLLVQTVYSIVSPGTEKMLIDFSNRSLLGKALDQPDRVKEVLQKIKVDGLTTTIDAVQYKLNDLLPLGYCNVGRILECSQFALEQGFSVGDFVVSNGNHAEYVNVPCNLAVKLPTIGETADDPGLGDYALSILGAIALQGIRLADIQIGDKIAVYGCGFIGRIAIDILDAAGAEIYAIDSSGSALDKIRSKVTACVNSTDSDVVSTISQLTDGRGVDRTIITASSKSNDILSTSAKICRTRGKVVLVGVIGNEFSRSDFFDKEISFQVSCSYGPGRYDTNYEENGQDYPYGYVRWTEKRNIEAIVDLIRRKKIIATEYMSGEIPFDQILTNYENLKDKSAYENKLIKYCDEPSSAKLITFNKEISKNQPTNSKPSLDVCFIGTGAYASKILAKAAIKSGFKINSAASSNGLSAWKFGRQFGIFSAASDVSSVLTDADTQMCFITTRHNSHFNLVMDALHNGKSVWCEKPLCLSMSELDKIADLSDTANRNVFVGFNRRESTHVKFIEKEMSRASGPIFMNYSINAGAIPSDHWVNDPKSGGGRFVGENCHFIDLAMYLINQPVLTASVTSFRSSLSMSIADNFATTIKFSDGSVATINYFTTGNKKIAKEEISLHRDGNSYEISNFTESRSMSLTRSKKHKTFKQDKGVDGLLRKIHNAEINSLRYRFKETLDFASMYETLRLNEKVIND